MSNPECGIWASIRTPTSMSQFRYSTHSPVFLTFHSHKRPISLQRLLILPILSDPELILRRSVLLRLICVRINVTPTVMRTAALMESATVNQTGITNRIAHSVRSKMLYYMSSVSHIFSLELRLPILIFNLLACSSQTLSMTHKSLFEYILVCEWFSHYIAELSKPLSGYVAS